MTQYVLRRFMMVPIVLVGVSILVFLMIHLTPGDPARVILGERATPEAMARLRERLGLNDPWYIQYWRFASNILRGNLGRSIKTNESVSVEIKARFPATIELAIASIIFASLVGVTAGILSATKQYSLFDYISMLVALIGVSMPIFWLGLMLILNFSVKRMWFPISGRIGISIDLNIITNFYILDSLLTRNFAALKDVLHHLVLPAVALGTIPMAIIARMTRSSLLEVLRQDYIKTARAKGLRERVVINKHALKNALIPVVTIIGLQFGYLLGGAILTETIFAWPGIGYWLYQSVSFRDFPAVQGGVLLVAFSFVLINIIVDISYAFLDPRIRYD